VIFIGLRYIIKINLQEVGWRYGLDSFGSE